MASTIEELFSDANEVFGTIEVPGGGKWKASYRWGENRGKGGFQRCLKIFSDANDDSISAHGAWGDDKFNVQKTELHYDDPALRVEIHVSRLIGPSKAEKSNVFMLTGINALRLNTGGFKKL